MVRQTFLLMVLLVGFAQGAAHADSSPSWMDASVSPVKNNQCARGQTECGYRQGVCEKDGDSCVACMQDYKRLGNKCYRCPQGEVLQGDVCKR